MNGLDVVVVPPWNLIERGQEVINAYIMKTLKATAFDELERKFYLW